MMLFKLLGKIMSVMSAMAVVLSATLPAFGEQTDGNGGGARLKAADVFANAPLEVIDMIRPSARLDMLDYYQQVDSVLEATDALGGSSRIETLSDDYMRVAVSPASTLEIKVLPYRKGEIVMTLYTTGGEGMARDTEVSFFDAGLKPVDASKLLKAPVLKDFFDLKGSRFSEKELRELLPFDAIEYSTGPGNAPLTAAYTTLVTLSEETRKELQPLLKAPLTSTWRQSWTF